MRRDELMKPDVLSEIILLASGLALIFSLLWALIASLTYTPALQ